MTAVMTFSIQASWQVKWHGIYMPSKSALYIHYSAGSLIHSFIMHAAPNCFRFHERSACGTNFIFEGKTWLMTSVYFSPDPSPSVRCTREVLTQQRESGQDGQLDVGRGASRGPRQQQARHGGGRGGARARGQAGTAAPGVRGQVHAAPTRSNSHSRLAPYTCPW